MDVILDMHSENEDGQAAPELRGEVFKLPKSTKKSRPIKIPAASDIDVEEQKKRSIAWRP